MLKIYIIFQLIVCLLFISCTTYTNSSNQNFNSISTTKNFEKSFLNKVNKLRAIGRKCGDHYFSPASALSLNSKLTKAAYQHSQDMSKHQFLEHTSSNGDTLVERMRDVNYSWGAVGENIAHNQKTIEHVLQDWLTSPGHCRNLMSTDYTQTGVAQVNNYWTQVYAAPK